MAAPHIGVMSVAPKCSSSCSTRRESHAERQTFNTRSARHVTANSRSAPWQKLGHSGARGLCAMGSGPRGARVGPPQKTPLPKSLQSHSKNLYCAFDSRLLWALGRVAGPSLAPSSSSSLPAHAKPPPLPAPPLLTRNQCPFVFSYLLYGLEHLQNCAHNGKNVPPALPLASGPRSGEHKAEGRRCVQGPPLPSGG